MPRFLALDWDAQHLHLVSGDTGRKGVRVDRAVSWALPQELRPAVAETLGRQLRDVLKRQGIAPAPVLASVGRERVILKEVRFPTVAAADEPALVRFQATKDLTDAPDDVILDYTHLRHPELGSERQAMAVIVRREIVASLQGLCRGLGVKLAVVTPRAYGLAGAVERAGRAEGAQHEVVAALSIGARWAELCVVRGRQVLFARSPAVGPTLAGEVKRSLALFAAQEGMSSGPPEAVYVAGNGESELFRGRLQEILTTPVLPLDPLGPDEIGVARDARGVFAAGVGLLHLWGVAGTAPINFLAPKQPKLVVNFQKRRGVALGIAAAVILLGLVAFGALQLADKRKAIAQLTEDKAALEQRVKLEAQDRLDVEFLDEWDRGAVSWLDELYNLAAYFPREEGFRLNQLNASLNTRKTGKDKDRFVAKVSLLGVATQQHDAQVAQLADVLNREGHYRATVERFKSAAGSQEFLLKIDLGSQPAGKHLARLQRNLRRPSPPPEPEADADADPDAEGGPP